MSHNTQETSSVSLTSDEQERLAKLLNHPDIADLIKEMEDKEKKN